MVQVRNTLLWGALMAVAVTGCDEDSSPEIIDLEPDGEGAAFDEENPDADVEGAGKADTPETYQVPLDLPVVQRPEIIISLATKTVHLFDRTTGLSRVYPTGPGKMGSSGRSWTPDGFFSTWPDASDPWGYIERRTAPDYFGGFPFLRLDTLNSRGHTTYGLHGPITFTCPDGGSDCPMLQRDWFLVQDYVSSGCMRMDADDIVELFWIIRDIPSVPVAIFDEVERDAAGNEVDLGMTPTLWEPGEAIAYGECGSRPDPWESPWQTPQRCGA